MPDSSQESQPLGFDALLESAATNLREKGQYSLELSSADLERLMRQVVDQSSELIARQGATAHLDSLSVQIADGQGRVEAKVTASKKIGFLSPSATIKANFVLENAKDSPGELETTQLEVNPQTIFKVVSPKSMLEPYIGGRNINRTFEEVLGGEMEKRKTKLAEAKTSFTEKNTLKVEIVGGKLA